MIQKTQEKTTMRTILEELRLLRKEVMLLLPQDDLKDYSHPDRINRSYQKAIKKHTPVSSWK
jgi:hypothetical protein